MMTSGSPYDDLDVQSWRRLLAQASLLQSAANKLAEFHLQLSSDDVAQAFADLKTAAREASTVGDDLDVVRRAKTYWRRELRRRLNLSSVCEQAKTLLSGLRACARTANASDPFQKHFDGVTYQAAAIYDECWEKPQLSLGWMPEHPRSPPDPYGIHAFVGVGAPPRVNLLIYPEGFGPAAYAALPWLLVHECVCHVPAKQGGKQLNSSPFAEGFMDWAARFFFERWMRLLDPGLSAAAREHCELVDRVVTVPSTPSGAARIRGRRAAFQVVDWLEKDNGRSVPEAEAWVAHLAILLNCCESSLAAKDRLVTKLNTTPWSTVLTNRLSAVLNGQAQACDLLNMVL